MTKKMLLTGLMFTLIFTLNGCNSDTFWLFRFCFRYWLRSYIRITLRKRIIGDFDYLWLRYITSEETECSKDITESQEVTVSPVMDTPKTCDIEKKNEPEKAEKPVEITKPKEEIPSKSEPKIEKEPELEIKSDPPKETVIKEQETKEETFNIDDWICYAKNYAVNIGLELDETAVDCWDNPIAANPKCTTIEENIKSRLNRYKNVEEFTAVWIWAEKISDNGYELYIGYA